MPTLEENKSKWDGTYKWTDAGEEWSNGWGTSYMQWHGTILPHIRSFLPAHTILEIAPGFGRWTEFLKDSCSNLILVDLSEKCIKTCQNRFASCSNITYFVNDGKSLDMIPDNTIDFIFSFDSLVHVEDTVMSAYISQISRKIKQNGVAFIHHSNLGYYPIISRMPRFISGVLGKLRLFDAQWRAPSMNSKKMQLYAEASGLACISQELITWHKTRCVLLDCISTIVRKDSIWYRDNKVFKNTFFMKEARNLRNLSQLYDLQSRR